MAFWQAWLGAGFSVDKSRVLEQELGSLILGGVAGLLKHPLIQTTERARMDRALNALDSVQSFRFLERSGYPETLESAGWKTPVVFYDGNISALKAPKVGMRRL